MLENGLQGQLRSFTQLTTSGSADFPCEANPHRPSIILDLFHITSSSRDKPTNHYFIWRNKLCNWMELSPLIFTMRKLLPGKGANHHHYLLGTPSNDRLKRRTLEGGTQCGEQGVGDWRPHRKENVFKKTVKRNSASNQSSTATYLCYSCNQAVNFATYLHYSVNWAVNFTTYLSNNCNWAADFALTFFRNGVLSSTPGHTAILSGSIHS